MNTMTLSAGLARVRDGIASLRHQRAKGEADTTAAERLARLREEEEVLADRLALAEAEQAEADRLAAEAGAIGRAQTRADAINDFLGRKELVDTEIAAALDRLDAALAPIVGIATELGRLNENPEALFSVERANLYARHYVSEIGRMIASTMPALVPFPDRRPHPWPVGSADWARTERALLFERILPDTGVGQ